MKMDTANKRSALSGDSNDESSADKDVDLLGTLDYHDARLGRMYLEIDCDSEMLKKLKDNVFLFESQINDKRNAVKKYARWISTTFCEIKS